MQQHVCQANQRLQRKQTDSPSPSLGEAPHHSCRSTLITDETNLGNNPLPTIATELPWTKQQERVQLSRDRPTGTDLNCYNSCIAVLRLTYRQRNTYRIGRRVNDIPPSGSTTTTYIGDEALVPLTRPYREPKAHYSRSIIDINLRNRCRQVLGSRLRPPITFR